MAAGRFTFPDPEGSSGGIEATRPHSQWRNRAGLAPDFPVMPLIGTQGGEIVSREDAQARGERLETRVLHAAASRQKR